VLNTSYKSSYEYSCYLSLETGNTKKLAETIYEFINGPKRILTFDQVNNVYEYDSVFVGFPIHEFGPSKKAREFFDEVINNKNVALFITHAMLKEAPLSNIQIDNCKKIIKTNKLLGIYSCRGALAESTAQHMSNSED
jgi:flavodoxin